jgi:hypothetical protein
MLRHAAERGRHGEDQLAAMRFAGGCSHRLANRLAKGWDRRRIVDVANLLERRFAFDFQLARRFATPAEELGLEAGQILLGLIATLLLSGDLLAGDEGLEMAWVG